MELINVESNSIQKSIVSFDIVSTNIDNDGTDNIGFHSYRNSSFIQKTTDDDNEKINDFNINIYRYKFTEEFTAELFKFSKIHQYDERKVFKEAWEIWIKDNEILVNTEFRRLKELGYEGDIIDKMFKSARYYFRKKSTEKKAPVKRREYKGLQKDFLETIDKHIKTNLINLKPSDGFEEFCKEHIDILKEQISLLCKSGITDSNEIKNKIKKTYKNRYFIAIKK
jgi:hypothetical protein